MACTDATGAPSPLGICKFNTSADAPSGLGNNAIVDQLDTLIAARVTKPSGIVSGETAVWNGSGWDRSSVTKLASGSFAGIKDVDVDAAAAIALTKLKTAGATKGQAVVFDGTNWVSADVPRMYARLGAAVDVNTTAAETTLFSQTITGNDMGTNKRLQWSASGDYLHNNVAADTITIRFKFGGTTFATITSNLGNTIGATRRPWVFGFNNYIDNQLATNVQEWAAQLQANDTAGGILTINLFTLDVGAIDTTANQTFTITAQWSASSVNNSFRMRNLNLVLV